MRTYNSYYYADRIPQKPDWWINERMDYCEVRMEDLNHTKAPRKGSKMVQKLMHMLLELLV